MYYNLIKFGKTLFEIRQTLTLSQEDVSYFAMINVETIRRIESGKVIPKQGTLDYLSALYKVDLNKLLLEFRLDDYKELINVITNIELKLDADKYEDLKIELPTLQDLIDTTDNTFYKNLIKQFILLIESVILNKQENKPHESYKKLLNAINITSPHFSIYSYEDISYNTMEMRLLMNIALLLNKIESPEKSLEILEFCINRIKPNEDIYPKICYNLSYAYHRLDKHNEALKYSGLGINYCMENRNYNGLNLLYFRKGIAEFLLGYDNYMDSLKRSLNQCELLGQDKLRDSFINNCKRIYNIDL